MFVRLFLAMLGVVCFTVTADAKLHPRCNIDWPCIAPSASTPEQARITRGKYVARQVGFGGPNVKRVTKRKPEKQPLSYGVPTPSIKYTVEKVATQILGGRPAGCPHRFCGCGASLHLFGKIIPSLNLAANWLRFPRAAPASGMVAARRGHVFVLKQHVGGNVWLAHDSNSGRGLTRLHARSIAGYSIVNPNG